MPVADEEVCEEGDESEAANAADGAACYCAGVGG